MAVDNQPGMVENLFSKYVHMIVCLTSKEITDTTKCVLYTGIQLGRHSNKGVVEGLVIIEIVVYYEFLVQIRGRGHQTNIFYCFFSLSYYH